MHDVLIALAGGAIGAVLAAVGFVAVRLSAVPGDVARHDRRAAALDEDLERWVADDHRKLRQELNRVSNDMNSEGLFYSGPHIGARAEAQTMALARYRDRRSESERALEDLCADESWPHARWRWMTRRKQLELRAPGSVQPVIDDWRSPVTVAGMTEEGKPHDPTSWGTAELVKDVRDNPLNRKR